MSNQINPAEIKIGDRLEWTSILNRSKPNAPRYSAVVKSAPVKAGGVWSVAGERTDGARLTINLNDPSLKHFAQ